MFALLSSTLALAAPPPPAPVLPPADRPQPPARAAATPTDAPAVTPLNGRSVERGRDRQRRRAARPEPRFARPTEPAAVVGYAPQPVETLPGYPGVPASATGLPSDPARTLGTGPLTHLFTDLRAGGVGDVITIVITQEAVAAATASKQRQRQAGVTFNGGSGLLEFLPDFGLDLETGSSGRQNQQSSFSLATTFTAVVVEVAPNGNLIVEGEQLVRLDGKPQHVKLRGEVRPYDVRPDNTVLSTRVANVQIDFQGVEARQQRRGFLGTVLGIVQDLFGILF